MRKWGLPSLYESCSLEELSKLAHRSWTFKAHGTGPESRYTYDIGGFRLAPQIQDTIVIFIDVEDRLRFARIEPDFVGGRNQDVDPPDVQSLLEPSGEELLVHRRFPSLFCGVQEQFVRFPAPRYECWMSHLHVGFSGHARNHLGVRVPTRVCAVHERLRHRAHLERVNRGGYPIREEFAQLPVSEVRSRIDIVEVEDERGFVVHRGKLLFGVALIKLCRIEGLPTCAAPPPREAPSRAS